MARPRSIWYRSRSKSYYTTHFGKQIQLGKSIQEAERNFAKLILQEDEVATAERIEQVLSAVAEEVGGWSVLEEVVRAMALRRQAESVKFLL